MRNIMQLWDIATIFTAGFLLATAAMGQTASEIDQQGRDLVRVRNYEAALAKFDAAIALEPEFARAHADRANALSRLDRTTEACRSVRTALDLDPRDRYAKLVFGRLGEAQCRELIAAAKREEARLAEEARLRRAEEQARLAQVRAEEAERRRQAAETRYRATQRQSAQGTARPLSGLELLSQVARSVAEGAAQIGAQGEANTAALLRQATKAAAEAERRAEEAERQRREAQRRAAEERRLAEERRRLAEQQRRAEEANERQRQAERSRSGGGGDASDVDYLVGSWRSETRPGGQHSELHVEGGGGNYRAIFAGRARIGDGLESVRTTVRNLTNTHTGATYHGYEGEANCDEFFGDRPHLHKGWQWVHITLHHRSWPGATEPPELRLNWGCGGLWTDPPKMTKR